MAGNAVEVIGEVRGLLAASGGTRRPDLLGEALARIRQLLAATGFDRLDPDARALIWTLGAAAAAWRARSSAAEPDDLDAAIAWNELAVTAWAVGDPNRPGAMSNLATALVDRFDRDGHQDDLNRALELFDQAIPALVADGRRVDIARHSQGNAYHDRAKTRVPVDIDDLDRAIALYRAALDSPDPDDDERAGYLNSLGLSLRAKGQARAERDTLREADSAFRAAQRRTQPGQDNEIAATLNLAAVLADRAELENEVTLLREAIDLYHDVVPRLTDDRRLTATTNLAAALLDLYRYTRDRTALDDATRELRLKAVELAPGRGRAIALANLGAALHEMYAHTGRIQVLDEAIVVQEELLTTEAGKTAERSLNLGISLLDRFRRRRHRADLDRAIDLFTGSAQTASSAIDRASALNSHANGTFLRFEITGNRGDLDECLTLREQAVHSAPHGSVDAALYRANLGVDLLRRFQLDSNEADLTRAIAEQRRAIAECPPEAAEQPRLLAGLADSLALRADQDGSDDEVAESRTTYRTVVEAARTSLPEQALAAAVRWGDWESRRNGWSGAGEAYAMGLGLVSELVGRQEQRSDQWSWLIDAEGVSAKACFAFVRSGRTDRAVAALEHGRAVLLVDALRRRRLTTHSPA